jgi:RNA-dependent RNA polymerase
MNYRDVIIFSVKGTRSAANVLGGGTWKSRPRLMELNRKLGDYDGDTGLVIFDPQIVNPFTNASLKHAVRYLCLAVRAARLMYKICRTRQRSSTRTSKSRLRRCPTSSKSTGTLRRMFGSWPSSVFCSVTTTTCHLLGSTPTTTSSPCTSTGTGTRRQSAWRTCTRAFPSLPSLVTHLSTGFVGRFCHVLDGQKSGKTVKKGVQSEDKDKYGRQKLFWCEPLPRAKGKRTKAPFDMSNLPTAKRPKVLGQFIMDLVRAHMEQELTTARTKVDQVLDPDGKSPLDTDLASPWREAEELAQKRESQKGDRRAQDELAQVIAHVDAIRQEHKAQIKGDFTLLSIERRQDILRGLSRAFALESFKAKLQAERPDGIGEIIEYSEQFLKRILASCIYVRDYEAHPLKANRLPVREPRCSLSAFID